MKKSTPLRSRSREEKPGKKEEKRITRMHQMEQMEAAARGTMPTFTLDTTSFESAEEQTPLPENPPPATGTFSSLVAGDFLSSVTGTSSAAPRSPSATTPHSTGSYFSQREKYEGVDQTINLMDASSKRYSVTESRRPTRTSFVDIFIGGSGTTSGSFSKGRKSTIKTSWKSNMAGKLLIGCFFLGFMAFLASSVQFLVTDDSASVEDKKHIRTAVPTAYDQDAVDVIRGSEAAASGPATFAHVDFDTKVEDTKRFDDLKAALVGLKGASEGDFEDRATSAFHALRWLTDDDPLEVEPKDPALKARFALASLFFATHQSSSTTTQRKTLDSTADEEDLSRWNRENGWMSEASVCEWFAVDCELDPDTKEKVVVHLNMTSNKLRGSIPMDLQLLDNLILLDLSNNELTGTIPPQLGNLAQVKYFLLERNQLSGEIPQQLRRMKAAYEIYLSYNILTGHVPTPLADLENLRVLDLGHNQLTGSTENIGGFTDINHLHLNDNKLEGPLPSTISELTMLIDLRLQNNKLTGTLPSELAGNTELRLLYLGNNELDGRLPEMFDQLHKMTDLELHGNRFKSELPTTMGALTSLRRLTLEGNVITGHLPTEWGKMTDLEALDLYRNEVVGTVPTEYGNMRNLRALDLAHNFLQGGIPSNLGMLTQLKSLALQHNAFKGALPVELGNLKNLEKITLEETLLTGTVPEEICEQNHHIFEADCKEKIECSCCTKCY